MRPFERLAGLRRAGIGLVLLSSLCVATSCGLLDPSPGPAGYRDPGNGGTGGGPPGSGTPTVAAGRALFVSDCARCHGPNGQGTTVGTNVQGKSGIATIVRNGKGSMPPFARLTDVEIGSLELFLASFGTPRVDTLMGAELYAFQCASCHGPAAEGIVGSGPGLQLATNIAGVARSGRGAMPAYPDLTTEQIASLERFLETVPFERTGRNLYVRYCQSCHGSEARGTNRAEGIRGNLDDFLEAVRNGPGSMPTFPELSNTDVVLIRAYVAGL